LFSQLLLALARDKARYGTTGTLPQYWATWKESGLSGNVRQTMDLPVAEKEMNKLLAGVFAEVRTVNWSLADRHREITAQDRTLFALCRPARLLELTYKFILFDAGSKKIARYQQYFTVQEILDRVLSVGEGQPRPGGVVWHTRGSGKFLTMVMLAKALLFQAPRLS
jgi:type I restriction enzyme, R subunit